MMASIEKNKNYLMAERQLSPSRRGLLGLSAAIGVSSLLPGCALPGRGQAVPRNLTHQASVLGIKNERFLIPNDLPALVEEFQLAAERRAAEARRSTVRGGSNDGAMLAVSGGGEDGAFGAGILCGWSDRGTRPTFELVTGVSTGALTAPFAFLGTEWDRALKSVYTDISPKDVLRQRFLTAALVDDALADNAPLFSTISRYFDDTMLQKIAEGYRAGRLLLIGTANIDAQLPTTWNIGAIANSGHPQALDLIRKILLASAAIPGAFPPVMIDVNTPSGSFQEMHVDGGAFTQVFLYPRRYSAMQRATARNAQPFAKRAYVIRNARFDPNWAMVDRRALSIAGRAISTMIASGGYNDIVRIWNTTRQDGVDFNLAYISSQFEGSYSQPFEQAYMRQLFDYAYERSLRGETWVKEPP